MAYTANFGSVNKNFGYVIDTVLTPSDWPVFRVGEQVVDAGISLVTNQTGGIVLIRNLKIKVTAFYHNALILGVISHIPEGVLPDNINTPSVDNKYIVNTTDHADTVLGTILLSPAVYRMNDYTIYSANMDNDVQEFIYKKDIKLTPNERIVLLFHNFETLVGGDVAQYFIKPIQIIGTVYFEATGAYTP